MRQVYVLPSHALYSLLSFIFFCFFLSEEFLTIYSSFFFVLSNLCLITRIHCQDSGEESSETESVYSLKCHISHEVNHLHEGLKHVSYISFILSYSIYVLGVFILHAMLFLDNLVNFVAK